MIRSSKPRHTMGAVVAVATVLAVLATGGVAAEAAPAGPSQTAPGPEGVRFQGVRASEADDGSAPDLGELTYFKQKSTPATGYVAPRPQASQRVSSVSATFVVTYSGFPTAAKASFQRAVDLWSTLIESDVPIRIKATYKSLPSGVLGGAGPADFIRDFAGAPQTSTWFPVALANSRYGGDLSPEPDIIAEFQSSSSAPWYFGTDGQVPSNKLDFTTVVLHEIGHGLGLTDSFEVSGSQARWGAGTSYPFRYDRFTQSSGGTPLVNLANYSSTLANALQNNGVRWGGGQAIAANGGVKPYLYSPYPFEPGSSIAHLDEDRYPTGTPNALMTPYLDDGEALHDPGDLGLAIMRDMGWTTAGAKGVPAAPAAPAAVGGNARVHLTWAPPKDTGRQFLTGYRVYRFAGGSNTAEGSFDVGANVTSTTVTGLANGSSYRFAVAARNASGVSAASAKSASIIPVAMGPFARADSFVKQQFADFHGRQPTLSESLTWLASIHNGSKSPKQVVTGIAELKGSGDVSPRVTRLYFAYFERLPDMGGYTYWTGKLRKGSSLKQASDTFAASSEFKNTYGNLSNQAFVTRVYANVLARTPDAGGLSYWTGKLNNRSVSRGQVMLSFSESNENIAKMGSETKAVMVRAGMLRRMPTSGEFAADVVALDGGGPLTDLAQALLVSPEYDARIP